MSAITRDATLHVFGAAPTHAAAEIEALRPGRRLGRALAVLCACWGAAVVSIFIPVAHFFLVPGFAVLGVVGAILRGRERDRLVRLRGTCPRCGREQEFAQGGRQKGKRWVSCPACLNRLFVTIESPESPKPRAAAGSVASTGPGR